jgi:hypothetical protein
MGKLANRSGRLGRSPVARQGTTDAGEDQIQGAINLLELQAKGASNIRLIDATPINRTRNFHHFFTDSPECFDDLYHHLLQPDNFVARQLYPIRAENNSTYGILWDY